MVLSVDDSRKPSWIQYGGQPLPQNLILLFSTFLTSAHHHNRMKKVIPSGNGGIRMDWFLSTDSHGMLHIVTHRQRKRSTWRIFGMVFLGATLVGFPVYLFLVGQSPSDNPIADLTCQCDACSHRWTCQSWPGPPCVPPAIRKSQILQELLIFGYLVTRNWVLLMSEACLQLEWQLTRTASSWMQEHHYELTGHSWSVPVTTTNYVTTGSKQNSPSLLAQTSNRILTTPL